MQGCLAAVFITTVYLNTGEDISQSVDTKAVTKTTYQHCEKKALNFKALIRLNNMNLSNIYEALMRSKPTNIQS